MTTFHETSALPAISAVSEPHGHDRGHWRTVGIAAALASVTAALFAAPWLWQPCVPCEWLGAAIPLLLIRYVRGWQGELWSLAAAVAAISAAFHWAPKVLAYCMQTNDEAGLLFAAPIIVWDAARLAAPFWIASRLTTDPRAAWLPAGLAAAAIEAVVPGVFPWKLGYSQIAWTPLVQAVDLFGPEFATFVLFAHAGLIVWLGDIALTAAGVRARRGFLSAAGVAAIAVVTLNLAYGTLAIAYWNGRIAAAPTARVALVQSNPEEEGGVDALRQLTRDRCSGDDLPDLVCWPECSGGSYEESLDTLSDPERVLRLSRAPNAGMRPLESPPCSLLFGGKIYCGYPEKPTALYQSAILIDPAETILGRYHKRHLMPFGEYVPGGDLYPDLKTYFPMQADLTAGAEPNVLVCGDVRLGAMLCYEDMIPSASRSLVRASANLLVSLINGAAFTEPLTLSQHRLLAQTRAIECRRTLVRCAATGETCVISPLGIVTARLPVHTRDLLVAEVPLLETHTLYSRIGPVFSGACAVALAGLFWRRRSPRCA